MKLVYSPTNQAYIFVFGDTPVTIGQAGMFHATRKQAQLEARFCGLKITRSGNVVVAEGK